MMAVIYYDIRYGIRSLLKKPGFTLIAVITLALGIGANTAIFSVVNALLLKPLAFTNLDRVVAVWERLPAKGVERNEVTVADYLDWRAQNKSFEQLGIYTWWSTNLSGEGSPERVQGYRVTPNFMDIVGLKPALGRGFSAEEDQPGKDAVVMLSYKLWQSRFGGDQSVINKTITTNGAPRTVIGVIPPELDFPRGAEIYAPLTMTPESVRNRQSHYYLGIGRLKPGVSVQSAQADLDTIAAQLEKQYLETNTGRRLIVYPILQDTVRAYSTALWVMMAAVGFVLLIGCANVANLMLARAAGRQREIALRVALGASRLRIIRQLLTESVLLGLVGGSLGILIGYWGVELIRTGNPGQASQFAPGWNHLGINVMVLGFTLLVSVLSGVLFGLAPALQLSKPDLNRSLKEGGRQSTSSSHRVRGGLVIAEVALSLMLLVSAGLLIRSFLHLVQTDPGFKSDNVITMNLFLPLTKYKEGPQRTNFFADLVSKVEKLPGVTSVGLVNHLPLGGSNSSDDILIEGQPAPPPGQENDARYRVCTSNYFSTMGIAVLKGRAFTDQDRADAPPVIIVNETLARKYWPSEDPIGKRIRFSGPLDKRPWKTVVGVVQDVKHEMNLPVTSDFYLPHAQDPWPSMVLVARTNAEPTGMVAPIRQEVWSIDKDQPVFDVHTMREVKSISLALYSFSSIMLTVFAGLALLLAAIGIYGVMFFAVTQRTQEIGIRMALGARAFDVLKLMLRHGMLLAITGAVVGLAGAFAMTRLLSSLLFEVTPTDVVTFALVTLGLLLVALFACYIPARRATKVDPLVALRYE